MKLKKPGGTVRLAEFALTMVKDLRAMMEHTTHIGGLQLNPIVKLTDGIVVAWALTLANMTMNPKCALINREEFLENLDREFVKHFAELNEATPDERRARFEMLVAANSEFSAYDPSAPLRATTPEGRPS